MAATVTSKGSEDFDFGDGKPTGEEIPETDTGGNLADLLQDEDEEEAKEVKKATPTRQGITPEIKEKAIALAESSKGLDIAAFQKEHGIHIMNIDDLLRG